MNDSAYQLARYHRRRREAIERLGGRCAECGSTEALEFDHIDPATKSFAVARRWSVALERYEEEVAKCQLLCHECHERKSAREQTTRGHGTHAMYRREKCRCEPCVKANTAYLAKYGKNRVWCKLCKKRYYKQCPVHAPAV